MKGEIKISEFKYLTEFIDALCPFVFFTVKNIPRIKTAAEKMKSKG